ncbi:MAG: hypothetical protein JW818_10260 [Pirellulales bacterium]|nr:hypothetical protein [Pirellulales bacterium]
MVSSATTTDCHTPRAAHVRTGVVDVAPPAPLSLRRNISWTFAGNMVNAGCQWGVIVVLAKLGTTAMVGQFALGLAIVTPIIMFSNLQLRIIQATDFRAECELGHYFALRLATVLVALLIITAVTLVLGYGIQTTLVILSVGVAKSIESISDVLFGAFQNRRRMNHIGVSLCLRGPFSLVFLGLAVVFTGSVLAGILGLIVARLATLLLYDMPNVVRLFAGRQTSHRHIADILSASQRVLRPRWDVSVLGGLAWRALPLGIGVFLGSLNTQIPRYFLEWHLSEDALGIFASLAYFTTVGTLLLNTMGQAAAPVLAKYHVEGNLAAFRRLLGKMVVLSVILGAAFLVTVVVAGRELLTVCYGPEYARCNDVFICLAIGAWFLFMAAPFGYAATASRRIRYQPVALAAVVLVSAIASCLFVGEYGLRGAAYAVIAGSAATLVAYRLLLPLRGIFT